MIGGHPALPTPASRPWLAVAVAVWATASLVATHAHPDPVPVGYFEDSGALVVGPVEGPYGSWGLMETASTLVLLEFDEAAPRLASPVLAVTGASDGDPGVAGGRRYAATVEVGAFEPIKGDLLSQIGTAVSTHVMERLKPLDPARGLLAGFLIGDTSHVPQRDVEAMRLAGLSHFVAVSGSNVALFLMILFVAAGPLALGPKSRALVGLLGLPIYAAATGFEPSVLRATVMAAIAMGGRLAGIVLDAWQLLAVAVVVLLVSDPHLTSSVGFQLSVAATAGVLVGARWPARGSRVRRALWVTVGAQLAVAPLLVAHFGSIPLFSPFLNLVAAPLVTAATLLGAVGVVGHGLIVELASIPAGFVLSLARLGSRLPQVGAVTLMTIVLGGSMAVRWPRIAPLAALTAAVTAAIVVVGAGTSLPAQSVVVLDVGQGDSILIHGGGGHYALVDGGPDESVIRAKLRDYRVRSLDLVVLTHVHADHANGLAGVVSEWTVGEIWADTEPHSSEASRRLMTVADGIPVVAPRLGERVQLGELVLEVLGPRRRYASPNDQSIVLRVIGTARTMLLSGDVETVAQAELDVRADVLKVPHQGAATSDAAWLERVGATLAIVSVGPNQFGHPSDWVIETLHRAGADVVRTDEAGDFVVTLS